jgi:glycosyltransferase involved in cell wall biosynthesis
VTRPIPIAVHFDPTKSTSGQRFFRTLCEVLSPQLARDGVKPAVVLFNVSARIGEIFRARLRGSRVVLRIDGLYFDRLSPQFIARFRWPLRALLRLGLRHPRWHDPLADLANLLDQNYASFCRILLANFVIYQSNYSRHVHARYFPRKPCRVIVNGSRYQHDAPRPSASGPIRLVTIFDDWKPAKRLDELVEFVRWMKEQGDDVHLTILGYTGRFPPTVPPDIKQFIESASFIRTLPKFREFEGDIRAALLDGDLYVTFTFRDPCPNAVVEAMAHGLPVVAIDSGGIPDIVGDAGVLLRDSDRGETFGPSRFESNFPPVDRAAVRAAILAVKADLPGYRARVRRRFETDLEMEVVARRYAESMHLAAGGRDPVP